MTNEANVLVGHLLQQHYYNKANYATDPLHKKAADLIETQAREIERLRGILAYVVENADNNYCWKDENPNYLDDARAALGASHD